MIGCFTSSGRPVMTADTVTSHAAMIKIGRYPVIGCMAIITGIVTGHMRRTLANGGRTIMTAKAGTDYLGIINPACRRPAIGTVPVLTNNAGLDMTRILTRRFGAVMTTNTVSSDATMIKSR